MPAAALTADGFARRWVDFRRIELADGVATARSGVTHEESSFRRKRERLGAPGLPVTSPKGGGL